MAGPKVLHVLQSGDRGGVQRHVRDVALGLPEATAGVLTGSEGQLTELLRGCGVATYVAPTLGRSPRVAFSREAAAAVRAAQAATKATVVHAHGLVALAASVRARLSWPLIYTGHGVLWRDPAQPWWLRRAARAFVRGHLWEVAAFVAVSTEEYAEARRLGWPEERIWHIPNGVAVGEVHGGGAQETIGAAARLVSGKGWEDFLAMVAKLPQARALVAGTGPLAAVLQGRAAALGVSERVRWLDWQDDFGAFLGEITVFVTLSRKEGLPYAVLDSLAHGVPVVASDIPAHREILDGGRVGRLVPAGDGARAAEAVAELLASPEECARLGRAGRTWVAARYGLEAMLTALHSLYERVAA